MVYELLGASPPYPHQYLCPWTAVGGLSSPDPLIARLQVDDRSMPLAVSLGVLHWP